MLENTMPPFHNYAPTVAVLGCGPSGMFFLHAIALRRQQFEQESNAAGLAALPRVTCFERASEPGGVWRANRGERLKVLGDSTCPKAGEPHYDKDKVLSTNMYEALWTNGPKETMEFFDYTFDEHFGSSLPVYLPRQLVLEYIMARVTRNNANFFDNVKFNTEVQSVKYNFELKKFVINVVNHENGDNVETYFDKCIWACGGNGRPMIPKSISHALLDGGFKGKTMHSSQTDSNFDRDVSEKNILIVGDSYSAEDLTLQAIKMGAESVAICSRSGMGIAYYTGSWPMDKVDIHYGYMPTGVTSDGYGIVLTKFEIDFGEETFVSTGKEMILDDIATVIYCTGYTRNVDMLDESLRPAFDGPHFSEEDFPKDWKMPQNSLSEEFGEIPIGKIVDCPFVQKDIYRGALISNLNMMFMSERVDLPLLDLDITAWLLLAQIIGELPFPSIAEMNQFNIDRFVNEMEDPICRCRSDKNYQKRWWAIDDEHWTYDAYDRRTKRMNKSSVELQYRILAQDMVDSKYPLQIGTYDSLNEEGEALASFNNACSYARYGLDENSSDASWKTFRDCDASQFYSIMTGTKAAPLKQRWLNLDENAYGVLDRKKDRC